MRPDMRSGSRGSFGSGSTRRRRMRIRSSGGCWVGGDGSVNQLHGDLLLTV